MRSATTAHAMQPTVRRRRARRRRTLGALLTCGLLSGLVAFGWRAARLAPERLANPPVTIVVTDRDGHVLLEQVAPDGQRRRSVRLGQISPHLVNATIAIEDARFAWHGGVDPLAVARAIVQNVGSGDVVSGASTITMQVCRMLEPRPRTFRSKVIESIRAVQLERTLEKDAILQMYLNRAPYGGNVRGAEAASRRWFGKSAGDLTLSEAALLAGLPQSPERLRPDRHPEAADARRRRVLERMHATRMIDEETYERALASPASIVGAAPSRVASDHARRRRAPHAAAAALRRRPAGGRMTIDPDVQAFAAHLVAERAATLPPGSDVAVVVIDVADGALRAMVGSADVGDPVDGCVNGALAWRSPGSALKPFIYAAAFGDRRLTPDAIVPDRRIDRAGWRPDNFDGTFAGPMTVAVALRRSRNVPALLVAEALGAARCAGTMESAGVRFRSRDAAARSGLTLAVGTAECTLLDVTNAYATLARNGVAQPVRWFEDAAPQGDGARVLDRAACTTVNAILSSHARAPSGLETTTPDRRPWFMWKTGTSSGRRDAWAVGHNRRFAVGTWVGRFDGAGDDRFVGATAAEPITTALLGSPLLEADAVPPPAASRWTVRHPFVFETEDASSPPRIVEPADGTRLVGPASGLEIALRVDADRACTWFVDGRPTRAPRVTLRPGRHVIRCASPDGRSDVATVRVFDEQLDAYRTGE